MAKSTSFAGNVAKDIAEFIANKLKANIPAWVGVGLGVFLNSKVGRALLVAAYKKGLPALAKLEAAGVKMSADMLKELVNQTLIAMGVKMNPEVAAQTESLLTATHAPQPQEWAEKAADGFSKAAKQTAVVAAACAAGVMIGNYFGKTISAFKGYKKADGWEKVTRILFPAIYTVTDTFEEPAKVAKQELTNKVNERQSDVKQSKYAVEYKRDGDGKLVVDTPIVTPKESGRQVVEYEMNKKGYREPLKTTNDKMVEFMNKRQGNHPIWYGKVPELVTTGLNYGVIKDSEPGFDVAIGTKVSALIFPPMRKGAVSQAYKDQIDAIYIKLRGSNSGAYNYDAVDVGAYIECVCGLRAVLKSLQRDLKLVNESKVYESNTPNTYLTVAGYSASGITDMKRNRSIYVSDLNIIADTLENRFPLPPQMTVVDRRDYVSDMILKESNSVKACFYIYSIDRVLTPTGTNQEVVEFDTADGIFSNRLTKLRTLIDNMYLYKNASYPGIITFTKISGDLVRAYGEMALPKYPRITESDRAAMIYDEYLLHQLQNSNGAQFVDSFAISGTNIFNAVVTCTVKIPGDSSHKVTIAKVPGLVDSADNSCDILINTNKNNVPVLETYSLTRDVYTMKIDALTMNYDTDAAAILYDSGVDILGSLATYYYNQNGTITREIMYHRGKSVVPIELFELWSQIDYFPVVMIFDDSNDNTSFDRLLDIDNYAFMSSRQLEVFNDVCTKSLYMTVPITAQANFKAAKAKK